MDRFLGDVLDKQIENYSQCSDCLKRSRACQDCRFHNSQRSLREVEETALIWKNMKVIQDPNFPNVKSRKVILIHYALDAPIEQLFPPSHSNSVQYRAASKSLFKKLKKKKLLNDFHAQMVKSINEGHVKMLSVADGRKLLKECHVFSGINYTTKF